MKQFYTRENKERAAPLWLLLRYNVEPEMVRAVFHYSLSTITLDRAAEQNLPEVVRYVMHHNLYTRTEQFRAFCVAVDKGYADLLKLIAYDGWKEPFSHHSARMGHLSVLETFHSTGVELTSYLYVEAAANNQMEVIHLLLSLGIRLPEHIRQHAIHLARQRNHERIAEYLAQ